jgi:hypothetical protein
LVVDEARDEEREFGSCEEVVVDESLPEGYGFGVGDALKCETQDTRKLAIDQSRGQTVDCDCSQVSYRADG